MYVFVSSRPLSLVTLLIHMISFATIVSRLSNDGALFSRLTYSMVTRFIDIITQFIPRIVTEAPR